MMYSDFIKIVSFGAFLPKILQFRNPKSCLIPCFPTLEIYSKMLRIFENGGNFLGICIQ